MHSHSLAISQSNVIGQRGYLLAQVYLSMPAHPRESPSPDTVHSIFTKDVFRIARSSEQSDMHPRLHLHLERGRGWHRSRRGK